MSGSYRRDGISKRKRLVSHAASTNVAPSLDSALKIVETLAAPFGTEGGSRVPDFLSVPTCTTKLELECTQVFTTADKAVGGVLELSTMGCMYKTENAATSTEAAIAFINDARTASNTWNGTAVGSNKNMPGVYSLSTGATAMRITGAAINVEFMGNDANNQGLILTAGLSGADVEFMGRTHLTSVSDIENWRNNYNGPAKNGALIRWIPLDNQDWEFGKIDSSAVGGLVFNRTGGTSGHRQFGALQWRAINMAVNASFRVSVVVHIEYLPLNTYGPLGEESITVAAPVILDVASALSNIMNGVRSVTVEAQQQLAATVRSIAEEVLKATNEQAKLWLQQRLRDVITAASGAAIGYIAYQRKSLTAPAGTLQGRFNAARLNPWGPM